MAANYRTVKRATKIGAVEILITAYNSWKMFQALIELTAAQDVMEALTAISTGAWQLCRWIAAIAKFPPEEESANGP